MPKTRIRHITTLVLALGLVSLAAACSTSPSASVKLNSTTACPAIWADSPLLLPCKAVPSSMVPDLYAVWSPPQKSPRAVATGCPGTQIALESEAFVTPTATDPLATKISKFLFSSTTPGPGSGSGLFSAASYCTSAADAASSFKATHTKGVNDARSVTGPSIGQQSLWFSFVPVATFGGVYVVWQEGNVIAILEMVGPTGTITPSTLAPLAEVQDNAIKQSHRPLSFATQGVGTKKTSCPSVWATKSLLPCSAIPKGLVADPALAASFNTPTSSASGTTTFGQCTTSNFEAYDNVLPAASSPTTAVDDAAADCGASAIDVYSTLSTDASTAASKATLSHPPIGSRSTTGCSKSTSSQPTCIITWMEGGWVAEIVYSSPSVTTTTMQSLAQAQNLNLAKLAAP